MMKTWPPATRPLLRANPQYCWAQRYDGLKAKLLEVQNQMAEAKVGFKDERGQWDAERKGWTAERDTWTVERQGMLEQSEQLRQALQGAEGMIGEGPTGKWNTLQAQTEALERATRVPAGDQ